MMRAALNEYPLFDGISGEDQKMLLPCINARLVDLPSGQTLEWLPEHVGLVLDGVLTADGGLAGGHQNSAPGFEFAADALLLFDSALTFTAKEHCLILKVDRHMMYSPCWFSCSFHHRLMQNADTMLSTLADQSQDFFGRHVISS